jgi:hypothetical protein
MSRFLEWLWILLPDRCEMEDCSRRGIRGNESIVLWDGWPGGRRLMCDYCMGGIDRTPRTKRGPRAVNEIRNVDGN